MDPLAGFLDGPRARGAFLLRSVMSPPWSLRIADRAPLTIVAMLTGRACIVHDGQVPRWIEPGDVAIIRGPAPYTVADDPATQPQVSIGPGQVCTPLADDSSGAALPATLGVRTWGNDIAGSSVVLTGTYTTDGELSRRLIDALPEVIVVEGRSWRSPVIDLFADELSSDRLGQTAMLDRLLDLVLIATLREWFERDTTQAPPWIAAQADPVVGRALRLLQDDPARPWSVAALAKATDVSRAVLARRFHELVGEPPMSFLAGWRLSLAADLLRDPDATVTEVARRVGYNSPFTFSTAFKRRYGTSPKQHRSGAAASAAEPDSACDPSADGDRVELGLQVNT